MESQTIHGVSYEQLDGLRAMAKLGGGRAVYNGAGSIYNSFTQPAAPALGNLPQGIQFFDFDTLGRQIFPVVTPLVNTTPRVGPVGGTAIFYREITDINVNKVIPGVSEGNRGAVLTRATRDRVFKFSGLGYENVASFESKYAALGVANPAELARLDAIKALKMAEERVVLYGFGQAMGTTAYTLGTPPTPAGVDSVVGSGETSTMTSRTVLCRVVALTGEGNYLASVATGVVQTVTRTNSDGSVDNINGGSSLPSVASSGVVVTATHKCTWSVADVPGALGYAWFTGTASATCRLAGITTINTFTQLADESGAAQLITAITADTTVNALEFSGHLTMVQDPNAGAYYKSLDGASLTADGSGNIKEFINAFYAMFTTLFLGPNDLLMNPLEAYNVTKILLAGPAAAIYAKFLTSSDAVVGGFYVSKILNPFTGQTVNIVVHPFIPQGHVFLRTTSLPYPVENLGNIWEVVQRQPYYIIDWAMRSRRNEVGAYVDEGLKCEFPIAQAIIKNIKSTL